MKMTTIPPYDKQNLFTYFINLPHYGIRIFFIIFLIIIVMGDGIFITFYSNQKILIKMQ